MAGFLMVLAAIISYKRGYPRRERRTWKEKLIGLKNALIPLLMPLIILGGTRSATIVVT